MRATNGGVRELSRRGSGVHARDSDAFSVQVAFRSVHAGRPDEEGATSRIGDPPAKLSSIALVSKAADRVHSIANRGHEIRSIRTDVSDSFRRRAAEFGGARIFAPISRAAFTCRLFVPPSCAEVIHRRYVPQ